MTGMHNEKLNRSDAPSATEKRKISLYDKMKLDIAKELQVTLGPNASPYQNGKVGGEITRRLVAQAKQQMTEIEVEEIFIT